MGPRGKHRGSPHHHVFPLYLLFFPPQFRFGLFCEPQEKVFPAILIAQIEHFSISLLSLFKSNPIKKKHLRSNLFSFRVVEKLYFETFGFLNSVSICRETKFLELSLHSKQKVTLWLPWGFVFSENHIFHFSFIIFGKSFQLVTELKGGAPSRGRHVFFLVWDGTLAYFCCVEVAYAEISQWMLAFLQLCNLTRFTVLFVSLTLLSNQAAFHHCSCWCVVAN